jgi:hypothetical protein
VSQAAAARHALHGWLYLSPLDPDTPGVRKFKRAVRELTQSELFESPATKARITLNDDEPIDAAAAKLYDGIYLWAKALSRVFSNNGAPSAWLDGRMRHVSWESHRASDRFMCVGRLSYPRLSGYMFRLLQIR